MPVVKPFECPECKKGYGSQPGLREHVNTAHKHKRHRCPYGCGKSYSQWNGMNAHVKADHENTVYPCPYKEKEGCKAKDFKQKRSLNDHIAKKHKGEEGKSYKCPDCSKKYTQSHNLSKHVKATHEGVRLPCPYKEEDECEADFATPDGVKQHVKAIHDEWPRFPCQANDCTKTFKREDYATSHYNRVHVDAPLPYSCGFCGKKFQFLPSKISHEEKHTQHACPRNSCYQGFSCIEEALEHAKDHQHRSDQQLYECPLKNCRLAIIGKALDKPCLVKHWNMHIKREHISNELELVYKEAKQPLFRDIPILGSIMANNHSILLASASLDNAVPEPEEDADEDDQGDEEEDKILVSNDEDINILEQNKVWWESHKDHLVSFNARGYKCAGPALGTTHLIVEGCPVGAIMNFDTALTGRSRGRRLPTMSLDSRCASCHSDMRVRQLIKRFDSPKIDPKGGLGALTKTFSTAISKTWTCTKDYERRVRQPVRKGLDRKVVIIDNEFDPITHELYETAIIDRVSGETLLNTLIAHTEETKSAVPSRRTQGEKVGIISQLWKKKVYGRSRGLALLDVHQVAKRLQECGITPETIFLAWHVSCADLQILTGFLAKGGYRNILPKDRNCFPLIPLFRENVPKGCFPLRFEIVYPVMFPRSDLCGHNHRALVDCKQARNICNGLDDFCEPVESRGKEWQPAKFVKEAQRCIGDYLA
ncbi:hypothetical protein IWW34DRAFT_862114 [Fusarium oxysporum f. sp. albedinis]|nr:hypothetical protein IWW34DRAFT_862114 [Fusarium oxysporum f. sp. albedinis]KAJ0148506.1 Bifunctional cytochrome P450/NADPH--P450 reductase [Fusarium oxysporum f. sp. albedinis]KAK2486593.1 hypothetical protein H9L39_00520 [Fusarium oxysporum f. sp. albedinis]